VQFWTWLWTIVWFGGLAIFVVISALVTIHGARDLKWLLEKVRRR
jgi:hypothetical protein